MDREPAEAKATKTTFVYDTQTGKVVHVRQFIAFDANATTSDREMEETAKKLAPQESDPSRLAVLHQGKEFEFKPEKLYRVDTGNRSLVVETAPPDAEHGLAQRASSRRTPARTGVKTAPKKG